MSVLIAGFIIGMRHALDADHMAALSVLVAEKPSLRRAAQQGAVWGVGHSVTLLLMGFTVIVLDIQLSNHLATLLECAVGLMLIALGIDLLRRWRKRVARVSNKRVLGVGLMHGLAGSSALILLTLSTLDTPGLAITYILLFGLGSILGMALLSLALAWSLRAANQTKDWAPAITRGAACVASIGLGLVLVNSALGELLGSSALG